MPVVILNREGLLQGTTQDGEYRCYAEVSAESLEEHEQLLDRIVQYAFDRLHVRRLEVRILDSVGEQRGLKQAGC
jgi:hypothetical protein